LIQVERLALSKRTFSQWFWCRQRCKSEDNSIPETWI